jgi:hypothetical protein
MIKNLDPNYTDFDPEVSLNYRIEMLR